MKEALQCLLTLLRSSAAALSSATVARIHDTSDRRRRTQNRTPHPAHRALHTAHCTPLTVARSTVCSLLCGALSVQSFPQSVRQSVLESVALLCSAHPLSVRGADEERLLDGFVAAVDGEKDPRCLVVAFSLATFLLQSVSADAVRAHCEALFDVVGCYFPITFTPPAHDPHHITQEELRLGLRRALTSHPALAPHVVPMLLDKAEDSAASVQLDALCTLRAVLERCAEDGGDEWRRATLPFLSELQAALKRLWLQQPEQSTEAREELRRLLTAFTRTLWPDDDDDSGDDGRVGVAVLSSFRAALFADLVDEQRVPDSRVARAYAGMTGPICSASTAAFSAWCAVLCPAIVQRYYGPHANDTHRQALLEACNGLLHEAAAQSPLCHSPPPRSRLAGPGSHPPRVIGCAPPCLRLRLSLRLCQCRRRRWLRSALSCCRCTWMRCAAGSARRLCSASPARAPRRC